MIHGPAYTTTAYSAWNTTTQFTVASFGQLAPPMQAENAIRADHPEVEWLRRRVREITDLVAA